MGEMNRFVYEAKASYAFVKRNFNLVKRCWGELVWLTCWSSRLASLKPFVSIKRVGSSEQKGNTLCR